MAQEGPVNMKDHVISININGCIEETLHLRITGN